MKNVLIVSAVFLLLSAGCSGAKPATPPSQNISSNETISPNTTTSSNFSQNVSSSSNDSANVVWPDTSAIPLAQENVLFINGFSFHDSLFVRFSGNSTLPEGTILFSQLYEDSKPSVWWPVNQPIIVGNSFWTIITPLGVNGSPDTIVPGHDYYLIVYKNSLKAEHHFFVDSGPPADVIPDPVNVVSVSSGGPVNSGGPPIEITLKNVSSQSIVSLNATLVLSDPRPFIFTFPTPVLPGTTISAQMILIGGGFSSENSYPLTINGTMQDGRNFTFTTQGKIQ